MAMSSILNNDDIKKALDAFAGDRLTAIKALPLGLIKITATMDKFVLKGFAKEGRDLTDKETKAFLQAADKDGDGKIGVDEFTSLVKE
eukprot:XP_003964477.1 PREDICTED: parvalbumin-7-like [Takifugu rubripes]